MLKLELIPSQDNHETDKIRKPFTPYDDMQSDFCVPHENTLFSKKYHDILRALDA